MQSPHGTYIGKVEILFSSGPLRLPCTIAYGDVVQPERSGYGAKGSSEGASVEGASMSLTLEKATGFRGAMKTVALVGLVMGALVGEADAFRVSGPTRLSTSRLIVRSSTNPPEGSTHGGLQYNKEAALKDPNSSNFRKMSDVLVRAEKEAKRNEEERKEREMADQRAREARNKKVAQLNRLLETPRVEVGTPDDFMWGSGVQGALDKLETELIGLQPVKSRVRELASMLVVDKMRQSIGLDPFISDGLHMCFTGSPGTGKTTVAFRMGDIFKAMGYCRNGHVVLATRDTLVGQYVGHTGPKTKEVIKQALGGILFIDEAYYLYNAGNDRDYGVESIEILLKVMEGRSSDLIVIFAGYKDKMDSFFSYIPGMQSRVNLHIDFPDMDVDDCVEVGKLMLNNMQYDLAPDAVPALRDYIEKRRKKLFFSNARSVRNAVDLARMAAANRVYEAASSGAAGGMITLDDLTLIKKEDFNTLLNLINNAPDDAILA